MKCKDCEKVKMANVENEFLVNYLVILEKAGRRFSSAKDNHWGGLIRPALSENPHKTADGLKVVLFASWKFGYVLLEAMKRFENNFPDLLNLVGLVTDNPLNPEAKISKKKRIWNAIDFPVQVVHETTMIEAGLSHGIPVYTGEIKTESFHRLLAKWNPEAILVCVFGQIIDPFIINYPAYGIYNFHPSDLARHYGAGPAPYLDLKERNAETTVLTIHSVNEEVDAGQILGQSPQIKVHDIHGMVPDNPFVVYDKILEALGPMVYHFAEELCRKYDKVVPGPIGAINFEKYFPEEVKKKLMLPIDAAHGDDLPPEPGSSFFMSI
jgi:folate-dependent phosphoribosylglycinamide formyltransferase PurN